MYNIRIDDLKIFINDLTLATKIENIIAYW